MKPEPIENLAKNFVKEYSKYVTTSRVLPHLDGLKPVQRRVLWALIKENARHGRGSFKKCASLVGRTMFFHPHGDASIFGALCNLVNSPNALLEGRGNFGSVFGDPPAAARYVECRTSELFEHILDPYMFEIGEFEDNYDETDIIPKIFQTSIPMAPLLGVHGIGVGLTTVCPSIHVDNLRESIINILVGNDIANIPVYAYGGWEFNNRIIPKFDIRTIDGEEYLHIYEIPKTCSAEFLTKSPLLSELIASKIVKIVDETDVDQISISLHAPQDVQKMILKSLSRPVIENQFKYYWGRLRGSEYLNNWIDQRLKFIQKREFYKLSKDWNKWIENMVLNSVHVNGMGIFDERANKALDEANLFCNNDAISIMFPTIDELKKKIKAKPISSIKKYEDLQHPPVIKEVNSRQILLEELDDLDMSLFSLPTQNKKSYSFASYESEVKRYLAFRGDDLEVKFRKIPRILNWEVKSRVNLIYIDGTQEPLKNYHFGICKPSKNVQLAGFTFPGQETVIVSESGNVQVVKRLGVVKEPISQAFPAKKLEINGKETIVKSGQNFGKVKFKILEV